MRPNPHAARTHTHTGKHGFDECSFQMHISECTYTYTTFFTTTSQSWRKILVNFCLGYHWWGFTVLVYTFTPLPWFNTLITFKDGGKHARLQDHVPVQTVCWPSRFCMGWGQVALSKSLRNHCKTTQNGKFKRCPSLKKQRSALVLFDKFSWLFVFQILYSTINTVPSIRFTLSVTMVEKMKRWN